MILPISHEDASVRRWPWVTFSLMALCFVVFLFTDLDAVAQAPGPGEQLEEAAHYWREHAYLEPDPRIRDHVAYDVVPNQRRQYLATLPELAEPLRPLDEESLAAEQAELDRLTAQAFGSAGSQGEARNAFQRFGFIPDAPRAHTLVTYAFLHAGWLHLIGNLFLLLLAGPAIEDRWGRLAFSLFYGLTGIGAALVHGGLSHGASLPLVGASGAIAGVLGAFLVRLWSTKIRFAYFFLFGLRPVYGTFEAAAWVMLPLWFGNELLQAMFWDSVGMAGGTAYWAHVGGFAFGVAGALGVRALRIEERYVDPAVEARITHYEANPVLEQAMAARERGDVAGALALLQAEWQRKPDEDLALALWDAAAACGQPQAGAPALADALRKAARRGELALAAEHWAVLAEGAVSAPVEPATLLRLVPVLVAGGKRELAARALRQTLDPANPPLTGGQALRVAELVREIDPPSALRAARVALASPELHEAKRAKLAALAAELEAQGAAQPVPEPVRTKPEAVQAAPQLVQPKPEPAPVGPLAPPPVPGLQPDGSIGLARFARAKLAEARPTGLEQDVLRIAQEDGRERGVRLDRIQAVSAAVVAGLGPQPVLVIDLLANWNEPEAEELRGVRLRSDRFDPRRLIGGEAAAPQAFAALIGRLLEASRGVPLPSAQAALGRPYARFAALADYQREVLAVAE